MPPTNAPPSISTPFHNVTVWPSFIPFGQHWNPLTQLLIELVSVFLFVILGVGTVVVAIKGVSRSRNVWYSRDAAEDIPYPLMKTLCVQEGVSIARGTLLRDIQREWERIPQVKKRVLDPDLVSDTVDTLLENWTTARIWEFCLRYHRPLSTLLDAREMDRVFAYAGLVLRTKNHTIFPKMVGIGESDTGMYVLFSTDPSLTLTVWSDTETVDILAYALDAPALRVEEEEGQLIALYLNDAEQRIRRTEEKIPE